MSMLNAFNPHRSVDEEYRKSMAKYSVSSMSNSKWFKLLKAIAQSNVNIERSQWQYINQGLCVWQSMPSETDILPTRFADGKFYPYEYKWIEWLFIPHEYSLIEGVGLRQKQETKTLLKVIHRVGKFDIEDTGDGLKLYAYRA